jgi:hypothetical protein
MRYSASEKFEIIELVVDAERVKLGQERHKVFQAAAQAIDIPSFVRIASRPKSLE